MKITDFESAWEDVSRTVKAKLNQPLFVVALIAVGIVCIVFIAFLGVVVDRTQRARPRAIHSISEIPTPAPTTSEQKSDPAQAVARFREKIMSIPESKQMISGIEPGVRGVVRIQMTNLWFDLKPHQKRQLVQLVANTWRVDAGTDIVIIHIYDFTGREVAKMSASGSIWIEDE